MAICLVDKSLMVEFVDDSMLNNKLRWRFIRSWPRCMFRFGQSYTNYILLNLVLVD